METAAEKQMGLIRNQDGTVTHRHQHGEQTYRQAGSGTYYRAETPKQVVSILEGALRDQKKLRVFYGDPATGRDWLEENDVEGRIGRSCGELKVPLMIASGEIGGPALLDHCIVRIQQRGKDVWMHPSYHQGGEIVARESGMKSHPFGIYRDGENVANFKTERAKDKWVRFITGSGPENQASCGLGR